MLIDYNSNPLPSQDILRGLERIDPALTMRWMPATESWAVLANWKETDPRHAMVQRGELGAGAAYDIVCHLPKDCPPDQVVGYLGRGMRHSNRDDVVKLLDSIDSYNEQQQEAHADAAIAPVLDDLDSIAARRLTGTQASFVNDATSRRERQKQKRHRR